MNLLLILHKIPVAIPPHTPIKTLLISVTVSWISSCQDFGHVPWHLTLLENVSRRKGSVFHSCHWSLMGGRGRMGRLHQNSAGLTLYSASPEHQSWSCVWVAECQGLGGFKKIKYEWLTSTAHLLDFQSVRAQWEELLQFLRLQVLCFQTWILLTKH